MSRPPSLSGAGGPRPPRIAFLAAYLNDEYEWGIWKGVREVVEQRGGSVVCFAGAGTGDPNLDRRARTRTFDCLDGSMFDGVLCLSSVVSPFTGVTSLETWLTSLGRPAVCIGPAERLPGVAIDDGAGIAQLVRHFVEHHGYRRIAFITGTPSNAEAKVRLSAYLRALADCGVEPDPALILGGEFTPESGAAAIRELFDVRQIGIDRLDAVLASNDYMAFGAIDELTRRRILVPDQVAVAGFDDIVPSRIHDPPLTTIRQPLHDLGRAGATLLFDQIDGRQQGGSELRLETEVVLRRSCGCVPTDVRRMLALTAELEDSGRPESDFGRAFLREALVAELEGAHGTFAHTLEPLLREIAADGEHQLDYGRRFADEFATRLRRGRDDLVHERLSRLARVLHTKMFGPQAELSTALASTLPDFGVDECAVCEFVAPDGRGPLQPLKLAFGFDGKSLQPRMATFEARRLVPPDFEHLAACSSIVMPLTCGAQAIGIAVLPATHRDGTFYETLAEHFGTTLKVLELKRGAGRNSA